MIKKFKWIFCFIITPLVAANVFANDELRKCEKNYKFCISYLDTTFEAYSAIASSHFAQPNNELINYLEKNLTNSNLLGFKIKGKPTIKIYKKSDVYYINLKAPEISKSELLWVTCAKISTECHEQNK